ncbi:hypothetical protein ACH5RR_032623 [Cinchona calisaya]|uniref:Uncharacterized protein n=1 Tax=Cinchona calisaya TaxID=153742 RepID=A0ABD2YJZ0_9GENT
MKEVISADQKYKKERYKGNKTIIVHRHDTTPHRITSGRRMCLRKISKLSTMHNLDSQLVLHIGKTLNTYKVKIFSTKFQYENKDFIKGRNTNGGKINFIGIVFWKKNSNKTVLKKIKNKTTIKLIASGRRQMRQKVVFYKRKKEKKNFKAYKIDNTITISSV